MFGFLTSSSKDATDPLVSAKSASAWLRQLPALDVIGRQQHVMRAFDAIGQSRKPIDIARVGAIEFLDAALAADRRQLTKQYVENVDAGPKLSVRIWQAVFDLTQGFIFAYQLALEEAVKQRANPRWKPLVPLLFARLLHYYGTDAKLRVARYERWIPAKWMELHRTYLRATELGVERVPVVLGAANPKAPTRARRRRSIRCVSPSSKRSVRPSHPTSTSTSVAIRASRARCPRACAWAWGASRAT